MIKYDKQSMCENSSYKLYYDRSVITDWTIHNNRPDTAILTTIQEAYLIGAAMPNSHNLHSTFTEKLKKYKDLKEELIRIWHLKMAYIVLLGLSTTGITPNKLHKGLKLLNPVLL